MKLPEWISTIFNTTSKKEVNDTIDKEFYYKLLDLNLDAIAFFKDGAGCIGVNSQFLSMFNISSLDEYSKKYSNFRNLFSDEDGNMDVSDDTMWLDYIHKMYAKGYGVRFIDKDEKIHHIQIFVKTIDHNEERLFYIILREAEELQKIQSHIVQKDMIKKEFLSKMGMQFRTPMQGILGFVKMLEKTMLDNTQKAYLSQVSIAAQELTVNLETLLDTAEMDETSTLNSEGNFHPFIEVDALINSFVQKAKEHQVKIYSDIDSSLDKTVKCDTKKLKQLLVNLLNYALDISHKNSDITFFMCKKDTDNIKDTRLKCSINVSDTIADPRRDDLSVIRKLITLLGGELNITCKDDGFASLDFDIVVTTPKESGNLSQKTKDTFHILVAEDNYINQNLMQLMLGEYGLDVVVASNGQDAIEKAKESRFDIVFMDIDMPVKNGIEATKEIKEARGKDAPFLPIVAVTALAMQGDRERLLEAGLDDYIAKPISRELLAYVLNKYIDIGV